MPKLFAAVLALLPMAAGPGVCEDSPLTDPMPAAIQDPSLTASTYFPPALVTAEIAHNGPARSSAPGRAGFACTMTNPCAIATPARDFAMPLRAN